MKYFLIDLKYRFEGKIERYIININNPKYYATFLTNKGPKKRYIRYGKFKFTFEEKEYSLDLYKSIGSDVIFIRSTTKPMAMKLTKGAVISMRKS